MAPSWRIHVYAASADFMRPLPVSPRCDRGVSAARRGAKRPLGAHQSATRAKRLQRPHCAAPAPGTLQPRRARSRHRRPTRRRENGRSGSLRAEQVAGQGDDSLGETRARRALAFNNRGDERTDDRSAPRPPLRAAPAGAANGTGGLNARVAIRVGDRRAPCSLLRARGARLRSLLGEPAGGGARGGRLRLVFLGLFRFFMTSQLSLGHHASPAFAARPIRRRSQVFL